jgi:DNA polymerase/3'-5' exonuclease PolX
MLQADNWKPTAYSKAIKVLQQLPYALHAGNVEVFLAEKHRGIGLKTADKVRCLIAEGKLERLEALRVEVSG